MKPGVHLWLCMQMQIPEDDEIFFLDTAKCNQAAKLAHDFTELIPIFSPSLFDLFN